MSDTPEHLPRWAWPIAAVALAGTLASSGAYLREARSWGGSAFAALPAPGTPGAAYRLHAPGASSVAIAADFTGWSEKPMTPLGAGLWEARLETPPGRRAYMYKVDGRWTPDPANPSTGRRGPLVVSVRDVR